MKTTNTLENDFNLFFNSLTETIKTFDYYVAWNKIETNIKQIEVSLNILNYLIGKRNFKEEFFSILKKYPEVVEVFPILIAIRSDSEVIMDLDGIKKITHNFKKKPTINDSLLEEYYVFFKETGLEALIKEEKVKNLVDYVFGIEVGMDTNARKNRTGELMENLIEKYLTKLPSNYKFIRQANKDSIQRNLGIKIEIDKTSRRFDFAIKNTNTNKLFLVEVNFYNGGGSKLKATAGEYKGLYDFLFVQNITFLWITDGSGWLTARKSLEETYHHNQGQIYNLKMITEGVLEEALKI
ncbi:MAG: type II restriction endonuclease [Ignavibacteria bacterium]